MSTEINVFNISYKVKDKTILSDVSFSVEKGETFALLGENGSGKSTLIDIILGDISPNTGGVLFFERIQRCFNKVGVVYDHLPLFPLLRVNEIIKYFAVIHKLSFESIRSKYYSTFEIEKINNSFLKELSQGEKKRVGLLLSIIHNPDLLILDEPFANLDPTIIDRIWKAIKEENRTVFFTTHNWKEVEHLASKICFIFNGRIIGKPLHPAEILDNLPATKKITLTAGSEILSSISDYAYYRHNGDLNVFFNENTDLLSIVHKHTNNFSVQDVDLKDAYLYYINK